MKSDEDRDKDQDKDLFEQALVSFAVSRAYSQAQIDEGRDKVRDDHWAAGESPSSRPHQGAGVLAGRANGPRGRGAPSSWLETER